MGKQCPASPKLIGAASRTALLQTCTCAPMHGIATRFVLRDCSYCSRCALSGVHSEQQAKPLSSRQGWSHGRSHGHLFLIATRLNLHLTCAVLGGRRRLTQHWEMAHLGCYRCSVYISAHVRMCRCIHTCKYMYIVSYRYVCAHVNKHRVTQDMLSACMPCVCVYIYVYTHMCRYTQTYIFEYAPLALSCGTASARPQFFQTVPSTTPWRMMAWGMSALRPSKKLWLWNRTKRAPGYLVLSGASDSCLQALEISTTKSFVMSTGFQGKPGTLRRLQLLLTRTGPMTQRIGY